MFGYTTLGFGSHIHTSYIFRDTFTDTSGTLLSAHTPDIDTVGGGWYSTGTTDEIDASGRAGKNATAGDNNFVNVGITDFELTVDFIAATYLYGNRRIYLDYTDATTWVAIDFVSAVLGAPNGTAKGIQLRNNAAVLVNDATYVWLTSQTIKATRVGNDINVYVDDVLKLTHTLAVSPISTVVGFDLDSRSDIGHFDNFQVTAL